MLTIEGREENQCSHWELNMSVWPYTKHGWEHGKPSLGKCIESELWRVWDAVLTLYLKGNAVIKVFKARVHYNPISLLECTVKLE